jgi:hypothetical protein
VFVEVFLYKKKNGYFSFLFYFQRKIFFFDVQPKQGIQFNQHAYLRGKKNSFFVNKKKGKISIFLFVEKGFYEHIIGEIITDKTYT